MFALRVDNEHGRQPTIINTKHIYDFRRKLIDQNSWQRWQEQKKSSREANRECLIAVGWAFVLMKLSNLNVNGTAVVVADKIELSARHFLLSMYFVGFKILPVEWKHINDAFPMQINMF